MFLRTDNNRNGADLEDVRESEVPFVSANDEHIQEDIERSKWNGVNINGPPSKPAPPPQGTIFDCNITSLT